MKFGCGGYTADNAPAVREISTYGVNVGVMDESLHAARVDRAIAHQHALRAHAEAQQAAQQAHIELQNMYATRRAAMADHAAARASQARLKITAAEARRLHDAREAGIAASPSILHTIDGYDAQNVTSYAANQIRDARFAAFPNNPVPGCTIPQVMHAVHARIYAERRR